MNPLNVGFSIANAKIKKSSLQTRTSLGKKYNTDGNCLGDCFQKMPSTDLEVNYYGEKMIYKNLYTPPQKANKPLMNNPTSQSRDATNLKTPDLSQPMDIIIGKDYKNK